MGAIDLQIIPQRLQEIQLRDNLFGSDFNKTTHSTVSTKDWKLFEQSEGSYQAYDHQRLSEDEHYRRQDDALQAYQQSENLTDTGAATLKAPESIIQEQKQTIAKLKEQREMEPYKNCSAVQSSELSGNHPQQEREDSNKFRSLRRSMTIVASLLSAIVVAMSGIVVSLFRKLKLIDGCGLGSPATMASCSCLMNNCIFLAST